MIGFSIIYNRKKNFLIEIRAYESETRIRKYYPTNIKVPQSEWSDKDKKVSGKNSNADENNFYLRKYIQDLENLRLEKKFKGLPFTFQNVNKEDNLTTEELENIEFPELIGVTGFKRRSMKRRLQNKE